MEEELARPVENPVVMTRKTTNGEILENKGKNFIVF